MINTYSVPAISCDHCKQSIEGAVSKLEGVESVVVDIDARSVQVDGPVPDEKVKAAIQDAGFEVAGTTST